MDWAEEIGDMKGRLKALRAQAPDAMKGFDTLSHAVKDNGPLDFKTKEFVALGMAVALRCEPCIGFHIAALQKAHATRDELGDVLAMAIQMGGGPAVMYAAKALEAWDQLADD